MNEREKAILGSMEVYRASQRNKQPIEKVENEKIKYPNGIIKYRNSAGQIMKFVFTKKEIIVIKRNPLGVLITISYH